MTHDELVEELAARVTAWQLSLKVRETRFLVADFMELISGEVSKQLLPAIESLQLWPDNPMTHAEVLDRLRHVVELFSPDAAGDPDPKSSPPAP